MSGQKKKEPSRKGSRWRLGRKHSSSDKSADMREAGVEREFRQGSSSSLQAPSASSNHRSPAGPARPSPQLPGPQIPPNRASSQKKHKNTSSQPQVPPRQVQHPPQEHGRRHSQKEVEEGEKALKEMMRSLSLGDDPSKFGAGTIAARKFQREELDAAMARNLFSRELAMSYMMVPVAVGNEGAVPRAAELPPSSPVDLKPLMHLRPAFTDEQWEIFKRDPLQYIHIHGLPNEAPPIVEEEPVQQMSDDFSILPEPLRQAMGESNLEATPETPVEEPQPPPRKKGMDPNEVSCILTIFSFYDDGQTQTKDKRARVKGRRLPKGAKQSGIISDQETTECAICLIDFEYGNKIGLLPCCHRFHADCIMDWLQRDATCPECREDLTEHVS